MLLCYYQNEYFSQPYASWNKVGMLPVTEIKLFTKTVLSCRVLKNHKTLATRIIFALAMVTFDVVLI